MSIREFFERVQYEGYTVNELEASAGGGGGKSGGTQTLPAPPIQTTTTIGSQLDAQATTFDEDESKLDSVDKAKLGTRGLQIPLNSPTSTTKSAATTGVQV